MKQCRDCEKEGIGPKPFTEFWKDSKSADGFRYLCKMHNKIAGNTWASQQPLERGRQRARKFRMNNPAGSRLISVRSWLKNKYGLSSTEYQKLFDAQKGRCAICGIDLVSVLNEQRMIKGHAPNAVSRVDHCHTTKQVRGLLCFNCNVGLGKFQDDANLLSTAARYLRATPQLRTLGTVSEIDRVCDVTAQGEIESRKRDLESSTSRGRRLKELSPFFN